MHAVPVPARDPAAKRAREALEWRSAVMAHDVGRVRSLVTDTGFFSAAEVDIAGELVTERLTKGIRSGYHFVLAERGAGTRGLRLLRPDRRHGRLVRSLLDRRRAGGAGQGARRASLCPGRERPCAGPGAKRIYADTSSSDRYAPTRGFYQRMGFAEQARLPDFYAPGDGKVVYVKTFDG